MLHPEAKLKLLFGGWSVAVARSLPNIGGCDKCTSLRGFLSSSPSTLSCAPDDACYRYLQNRQPFERDEQNESAELYCETVVYQKAAVFASVHKKTIKFN